MYLDWLLLCATHIGLDNRGSGCPKKFARTLCISSSGWSKVPLRCTTATSCAGVGVECICVESVLGVRGLIALGTPLDASTSVCRIDTPAYAFQSPWSSLTAYSIIHLPTRHSPSLWRRALPRSRTPKYIAARQLAPPTRLLNACPLFMDQE